MPPTTATESDAFPECLHGDWIASNDWFANAVGGAAAEGGVVVHHISGDVLLSFSPDGTVQTNYRQWTNAFEADGAEIAVTRDGIDTGTYTVDESGQFTMTDTNMSSEITMTIKTPDGTMTMPAQKGDASSQSGSMTCMDQLLLVEADGVEMMLGRPGLMGGPGG